MSGTSAIVFLCNHRNSVYTPLVMRRALRLALRSAFATVGPSARDSLAILMVRMGWIGAEFAVALLLARQLGAAGYGSYAIAMVIAPLAAAIATLGFDRMLVREVAFLRQRGQTIAVHLLLRRCAVAVLAAAALSAMVAALYLLRTLQPPGPTWAGPLAIVLFIPAVALLRVLQGTLQGMGAVVIGQTPEFVIQPLIVLLGLSTLALWSNAGLSVTEALRLQVLAAWIGLAAGFIALRLHLAAHDARHPVALDPGTLSDLAGLLREGSPFVAIFAATLALGGTDLLMIGTLLGSSAAGPYRAGAQIAAVVAFPMTALNLALASRIATAHAAGDLTRLQRLATLAARIGGSIGLGLAVLVWTMGPWLLRWFGTGFEEAHSTMTILSLAFAIHAASGTAGYMLIMTEHAGTAARWFALAAVAALLLQWLLIPLLGTVGAALGTLAGLAVLSFGLTRATRRLLGISTGLIGQ